MKDHEDNKQSDTNLTELTQYQLRFIDEYMKCGNKCLAMLSSMQGTRAKVNAPQ